MNANCIVFPRCTMHPGVCCGQAASISTRVGVSFLVQVYYSLIISSTLASYQDDHGQIANSLLQNATS